jgi:hypothetical protein
MATIYSGADLVIGWLGSNTPAVKRALELLELIWAEESRLSKEDFLTLEWLRRYPSLCKNDLSTSETVNVTGNAGWDTVTALFQLSYWKRVWIFQEATLATTLVLCADDTSLQYSKLDLVWSYQEFLQKSFEQGSTTQPDFIDHRVWMSLNRLKDLWYAVFPIRIGRHAIVYYSQCSTDRASQMTWLLSLVGRHYQATNPKDDIYGLLGVVKLGLIPDYRSEKSVGAVYEDYVKAWLHCYQSSWKLRTLFFLKMAGTGSFENPFNLPTWTPNYPEITRKGILGTIGVTTSTADTGVFENAGLAASIENGTLIVEGVQLDVVHRVNNVLQGSWHDGTLLAHIADFVSRNPVHKAGIHPLQAVFRVLKRDIAARVSADVVLCSYAMMMELLEPGTRPSLTREAPLGSLGIEREAAEDHDIVSALQQCIFPEVHEAWSTFLLTTEPDHIQDIFKARSFEALRDLLIYRTQLRFCEVARGYLGLAPVKSQPGDLVCVLNGYNAPFLLRKVGEKVTFVGECFILGLMNGEAKDFMDAEGVKVRTFRIS